MVEFGLGGERVVKVAGKADTDHLLPDKPSSPLNRRISIILQKQKPLTELPQQASDGDTGL
jgi:flagellar motor protein MotB